MTKWEIYSGQSRIERSQARISVVNGDHCVAVAWGTDIGMAREHAKLIAAAPDLLAALEELLFAADHGPVESFWVASKARAAIDKATN